MSTASAILVVLITLLFPPAGVFCVAGCGVDILVNICLTLLGYIPGHIHAFYLEYVYYKRKNNPSMPITYDVPGVYSKKIMSGGRPVKNYGPAPNYPPNGPAPANYPPNGPAPANYQPNGPAPNYGPNYGTVS